MLNDFPILDIPFPIPFKRSPAPSTTALNGFTFLYRAFTPTETAEPTTTAAPTPTTIGSKPVAAPAKADPTIAPTALPARKPAVPAVTP